jgi:RHS repeat-associated protein
VQFTNYNPDGQLRKRLDGNNVETDYTYNDPENRLTFVHTFDAQGDVSQRTDSGGNVLSTSVYDAFGQKLSTDPQTDPWGYHAKHGYYTDAETGLILCTHRYYDPAAGRWLNRDPIGYGGGINLYGYVGNGAVGGVDSSGYDKVGPDPNPDFQRQLDNAPLASHCRDYNALTPQQMDYWDAGDVFPADGKSYDTSITTVAHKLRNFSQNTCDSNWSAGKVARDGKTCSADMPTFGSVVGIGPERSSCASHWSRDAHGNLTVIGYGSLGALHRPQVPIFEIRTCGGVSNAEQRTR